MKYTWHLIRSFNGSEISVLNSFNIFVGMLLGSIALFGLMQLIKDSMSARVVAGEKERQFHQQSVQDSVKTVF